MNSQLCRTSPHHLVAGCSPAGIGVLGPSSLATLDFGFRKKGAPEAPFFLPAGPAVCHWWDGQPQSRVTFQRHQDLFNFQNSPLFILFISEAARPQLERLFGIFPWILKQMGWGLLKWSLFFSTERTRKTDNDRMGWGWSRVTKRTKHTLSYFNTWLIFMKTLSFITAPSVSKVFSTHNCSFCLQSHYHMPSTSHVSLHVTFTAAPWGPITSILQVSKVSLCPKPYTVLRGQSLNTAL